MKLSDKICRIILFGLLLTALSCAIWQNYITIFKIKSLNGSVVKKEVALLNFQNWFSGAYQLSLEEDVVLNNALSPFFIRVNNQIDYSLFDRLHMSDGILGKQNYLYDQAQVKTYFGKDLLSEDTLRMYVEKIKFIQDTLMKLNKKFIYIQAPSKVSFFPEYLPDSLQLNENKHNNYHQLMRLLDEYKINYIDFRQAFIESKKTSSYPLFPQTGIHWSKYATGLVMDSINNFIESSMKVDLPELYWDEIELDYARHDDDDLEGVMNLLFRLSNVKYAYPKFKYESKENKDTPAVLMVGDSFLGNLYIGDFYKMFDKKSQYWFYNLSVFSPSFPEKKHKYQFDQIQIIKNSDVVILGSNEPNIYGLSWTFIDNTYDYFKYGKSSKVEEVEFMKRVDSCKTQIMKRDYKKIEIISRSEKISIDSAKTIFAIWKLQMSSASNKK